MPNNCYVSQHLANGNEQQVNLLGIDCVDIYRLRRCNVQFTLNIDNGLKGRFSQVMLYQEYCKSRIFREGYIFAKLRICSFVKIKSS